MVTRDADAETGPVCGMRIDKLEAVVERDYEGRRVYFCSAFCEGILARDPEQYGGPRARKGQG